MPKSPDAFRTISEVAEWLGIQAHVLRFWESKFTQVKPIKRAGGRRYYRPTDMALLGGIKKLLHDDGLTIKGVQKILREEGMSHVSALSPPLDDEAEVEITATPVADPVVETTLAVVEPEEEKGVVLPFDAPSDDDQTQKNIFEDDATEDVPEVATSETGSKPKLVVDVEETDEVASEPTPQPPANAPTEPLQVQDTPSETEPEPFVETKPEPEPEIAAAPEPVQEPEPLEDLEPATEPRIELEPFVDPAVLAGETPATPEPVAAQTEPQPETKAEPEAQEDTTEDDAAAPAAAGALPAFLRRPMAEPDDTETNAEPETQDAAPVSEPAAPAAPKPRVVDCLLYTSPSPRD